MASGVSSKMNVIKSEKKSQQPILYRNDLN